MFLRSVLIAFIVALVTGITGFTIGFQQGAQASLWSDFVLKGVIADQRLQALEKQNYEFLRGSPRGDVSLAFIAQKELLQFKNYAYFGSLIGIELYGLDSQNINRLEKYKNNLASPK